MDLIKEDRYFDPDRTWKGLAVVITNFLTGPRIRVGADNDEKYMTESFKRLGFEVIPHKDVTKPKLGDLLDEYSKRTDLDCFALAISSHGCEMEKKEDKNTGEEKNEKQKDEKKIKQQAIEMFDENYVFTHDILDRFSDGKCPGLKNKPKIFLLQACRIPDSKSTEEHRKAGIGYIKGYYLPTSQDAKSNSAKPDPADATNKKDSYVEDQDGIDPAKAKILYPPPLLEITFVPCYNDMLIVFACPEGHYAIRNQKHGSYMLKHFSESVDACYTKYGSADLMDILKDVTYKMSELEVADFTNVARLGEIIAISGLTVFIKGMESFENDLYHFDPDRTCQGLALVITNFTSGKDIREGADSDHKNMKKSFKRLGFEVICHKDVSKSKLTDLLDQYSRLTDWNKYNCFAFAISSHGYEMEERKNGTIVKHHAILMVDGSHFYTKDVVDSFSDRKCTDLINKPKIFLIQACRIPNSKSTAAHQSAEIGFDRGCFLPNPAQPNPAQPNPAQHNPAQPNPAQPNPAQPNPAQHNPAQPNPAQPNPVKTNRVKPNPLIPIQQTALKADVNSSSQDTTNKKDSSVEDQDEIDPPKVQMLYPPASVEITLVPCHNDMLIMFACPEDHYAFRDPQCGCYMLRLFKESVGTSYTKSGSANLMDMLRDVTYQMSEMTFHGSKEYKTVPCIVHKLRKDVIFTHGRNMVETRPHMGGGCCACAIM